jgi:hypothetical protein
VFIPEFSSVTNSSIVQYEELRCRMAVPLQSLISGGKLVESLLQLEKANYGIDLAD